MIGRYIKYDKSGVEDCKRLLGEAYTELGDVLRSVDNFIATVRQVDKEDLYQEDTSWVKDTLGEWVERTFVKFDWRNAYKTFCSYLDSLSTENGNTRSTELETELKPLKNAVEGLVTLVDEFDLAGEFNLVNEYVGKSSNVVVEDNGSTAKIYYIDENGAQITLSQLLNCFYTYSGMAISSQLKGFMEASANGVPFDAEYQMGLLNQVNGTIDALKDVGAFGVASDQDIIGLSDALVSSDPNFRTSITQDGNGNLINNVGGNWTSNMEAGSITLLEYPLSDYVKDNPLDDQPQVPDGPQVPQDDPVVDPPGPGGPGKEEEPTPDGPEETLPPGPEQEDPTDPTKPLDIELIDVGGADDFKNVLPDIEHDYDSLARQMFEGMSDEELLAFREQSINRATGFIDSNDVESIANDLSGYGYSDSDIGNFVDVNNGVVKNPDAVIAAYVAGDQNNYMASMANNMAKNDGVTGFTSSHGANASYSNHKNGNVNANIANMHDDEEVDEASKKYQGAKTNYKQKADEANEAAEEAKEAQAEVKAKVEEYGEDTSKWTEEQAKEYNEAKENYEQAKENYEEKVEEFKEAEQEYQDAKEGYDTAKENFENEVKENVKANEEFYENQTEEVNVSDDQLVEEVGGTGESDPSSGDTGETSGETTTDTSGGGAEQNADTVDTQTHEGTVNNDGTVSASDQGLVDSVLGGNGGDAGAAEGSGLAMSSEGDVSTAASESGIAGDGLATSGDTGLATGETSTEPNNGIDGLRDGVDTPDVETSGMSSQTTLETAPASETGIITEGNTAEMSDISGMNESQGMEQTTTEVTQETSSGDNNPLGNVTESSNNDAAIAQQMAQEEAARNEKQKAESAESSDTGTQPTQTVQTATAQTQFRTDAGVKVESSGNENVVSVGNDALLNSIITE